VRSERWMEDEERLELMWSASAESVYTADVHQLVCRFLEYHTGGSVAVPGLAECEPGADEAGAV
jgi:hypothetical protein